VFADAAIREAEAKKPLRHCVQITTDGHQAYLEAIEGAFGADVDYAMPFKVYGETSEGQKRYSLAECIGCYGKKIEGRPDARHVSTSLSNARTSQCV